MPITPTPNQTTPAQRLVVKQGAGTSEIPANGAANAANGAAPDADLRSQLEMATKKITNLQSVLGKQSQELGVLRQRSQYPSDNAGYGSDYGYGEEEQSRNTPQSAGYNAQTLQRLDFVDFRMDNPDWREHWPSVQEIINDPLESRTVVAFRQDTPGVPDYFVTYTNALRVVKLRAFEAAKAETEKQKALAQAELDKRQKQVRTQAMASDGGGGVAGVEQEIDLNDGGSSADLLKQFPDLVNPADPPSMFKRR